MERRYLAATIAMAATFALFSHAFSSGLLTRVHDSRPVLISEMHCAAQTLRTRLLDKVNRSFGSGNANAEEAQLRVELNLPVMSALAAAPAVPAVPSVAPAAPAKAAPPVLACPSQRLTAMRHQQRDFERAQARAIALQSRALANQAKLMAVQVRLTSDRMQREMTRAALVQARANIAQAKVSSHPCGGARTVHVASRTGDNDVDINVDMDQLSNQIEEQISRSLRSNARNF